ncbi:MAG: Trk system potassium transporter TrkA [Bacteroidaceae bacterium]|nr:Trk system potassium transporter TrkA [Bacteroidaceae bacterium]MBR6927318.1 Trk system potassium transporter TrkA [Bacteroidaceae bacterium]
MKIVIAGAGAVGMYLSKLLSRERHDITLIDEHEERVASLSVTFDLKTLAGNPMALTTLKEANVGNADLFVAVTPDEAHNLTCCILAKKLGAKKTVARVDNDEFTHEAQVAFFKEIGVQSIIYPELLAAKEIAGSIKRSWIRQYWEVGNGALVMLGVKVRNGATIVDEQKTLRELCGPEAPFHIVAIKRGDDTIIPHGDDVVRPRDIVFFMTTPQYVPEIRALAGKEGYPDVNNLMVMGGSDTAVQMVNRLPEQIRVRIIEKNLDRCHRLSSLITNSNCMVLHGDATDIDLLEDENIDRVDAFAAMTDNSEKNILACLNAKKHGVRKTVAIVENTDYVSLAENFDIGTIINKKSIAASHIYRMMLRADLTTVKSLTVANADVCEIPVSEDARVTKKPVMELGLPPTVNLGGIVRNGRGILINGRTQILPGDTVVAFCLQNTLGKLEKFFK